MTFIALYRSQIKDLHVRRYNFKLYFNNPVAIQVTTFPQLGLQCGYTVLLHLKYSKWIPAEVSEPCFQNSVTRAACANYKQGWYVWNPNIWPMTYMEHILTKFISCLMGFNNIKCKSFSRKAIWCSAFISPLILMFTFSIIISEYIYIGRNKQ